MNNILVSAENLSKNYLLNPSIFEMLRLKPKRSVKALHDISFKLNEGECVGILGPNGAGKSTLLKLLSKTINSNSGVITINRPIIPLLELGAGFHPLLTGRENIFLNAGILGFEKRMIEEHIDDIIDFADIREYIDLPIKKYSSGMFVRLAFSIAVNLPSSILLIDEVLAVGDIEFQSKCIKKITELKAEGMGIIFVSHNIEQIRRICDRCILLLEGGIKYSGGVESSLENYFDYIMRDNRLNYLQFSSTDESCVTMRLHSITVNNSETNYTRIDKNGNINIKFKISGADRNKYKVKINFVTINGIEVMEYTKDIEPNSTMNVEFEIEKMSIQSGIYLISYSIFSSAGVQLLTENNRTIIKVMGDNEGKMFSLPHKWKI